MELQGLAWRSPQQNFQPPKAKFVSKKLQVFVTSAVSKMSLRNIDKNKTLELETLVINLIKWSTIVSYGSDWRFAKSMTLD